MADVMVMRSLPLWVMRAVFSWVILLAVRVTVPPGKLIVESSSWEKLPLTSTVTGDDEKCTVPSPVLVKSPCTNKSPFTV